MCLGHFRVTVNLSFTALLFSSGSNAASSTWNLFLWSTWWSPAVSLHFLHHAYVNCFYIWPTVREWIVRGSCTWTGCAAVLWTANMLWISYLCTMWQTEYWLKEICQSACAEDSSPSPLMVIETMCMQTPCGWLSEAWLAGITSHSSRISLCVVQMCCDMTVCHLGIAQRTGGFLVRDSKCILYVWLILPPQMQVLVMCPEHIPIPLQPILVIFFTSFGYNSPFQLLENCAFNNA